MKLPSAAIATGPVVMFLFLSIHAAAQPVPLHVLVSNGIKPVIENLKAQCEKRAGHPMVIEYSAAALLKKEIDAGQAFDIALLTTESINKLIEEGKIAANSSADLGRAFVGVGIRSGAPKPDIGTPDALRQTLLKAKSITYAKDGASRVLIEKMYDRLGLTSQVQPKVILQSVPGRPQTAVAGGEAEMILAPISEIVGVRGVELVGPFPKALESFISFRGGISASTKYPDASRAVISFFTSSEAVPVYKARGLEPAR